MLGAALAAAFCIPFDLTAQVNTEKLRGKQDELGFQFMLDGEIEYKTGNVEFLDYEVQGRIDYIDSTFKVFFITEYAFTSSDGKAFARRGFYHLRYNQVINDWLTWEVFGQEEDSRSLKLKNRWIVGSGPRFSLLRKEKMFLALGSTYMYEHEHLIEPVDPADDVVVRVHRWNNYLTYRIETDNRISWLSTVYVQPRFDAFDDVRVFGETALGFGLWDFLTLKNSFKIRYDSQPPVGIKETDIALTTGIVVSF